MAFLEPPKGVLDCGFSINTDYIDKVSYGVESVFFLVSGKELTWSFESEEARSQWSINLSGLTAFTINGKEQFIRKSAINAVRARDIAESFCIEFRIGFTHDLWHFDNEDERDRVISNLKRH